MERQFGSSAVVAHCQMVMGYLESRFVEVAFAEDHLLAVDFDPGIPYNLVAMELRHIL